MIQRIAPLALGIAGLCVVALAAWLAGTDRSAFSYDDREILESPIVTGARPWMDAALADAWEHRGAAGHWRPLALWSLRRDLASHGPEPSGFAKTNLILHLAVLILAGLCWWRLTQRSGLALGRPRPGPWRAGILGLAVFAAHPALADSVAWISGRTSMLCAFGGLTGLLALACALGPGRSRPKWAACAAGAGLLMALAGKEDGLAFAPIYLALAARAGALRWVAAGVAAAFVAWIGLRLQGLGAVLQPPNESSLGAASLLERLAVGCAAFFELFRVAVLPVGFPPAWRAEALDPEGLRGYARTAAGACLFLGLACGLAWSVWRTRRTSWPATLAAGGACASLCALVPVLQLVPLGEVAAPRFLYLPLLFGAPLIGLGLSRGVPGPGQLVLLVALAGLSHQRASVYESRLSYWEARLPFEARSPQVWNALGNAHLEREDSVRARVAFERAVEIDPEYSRPWTGLAILALESGADLEAEQHLMRAIEAGPANPIAWANAGALWLRTGAFEAAAHALERATVLAPGRPASWRALARAYRALGREAEADQAQASAERLDPSGR